MLTHNPNPAFTMQAEYFRNIDDPIPSCSVVEVTSPNGGETWSGGDTENIAWTSSDVTNVNIEFSSDNGSSWNTVATSVDASSGSYTFAVPNINSTECLVRISDTDNSSIFDISDAVFTINTVAVDPTITIGSSTTVAGSYVTIPIDLTAPSGFKIDYLLQGKIHFDASKLKFLYGDYDAGTLVNDYGWTGTFYSAIPGTVDIILSGANPLNNSGTMFYLTFQVIDGNAGSADLSASSAEWPVDVLETPLTVVDGSVTYSDNSGTSENRGDATLNYIVDIYDALAVIYHWVGIYPLSGQAFINADVNFDGHVNIKDYLRIIFFVYLHDWDFVFPSVSPSSSIVLNGGEFEDSETFSIPIRLENSSNVQSAEIQFEYDPNELEFINVHSNIMNLRTADNNGTLSVVATNLEEISNGEIASVRFRKLNTSSSTEVNASYNLNEEQLSNSSLLTIGNGTITNVEDDIKSIPTEYELSQNYPNPFNPSTVIKFAVPKSGNYKLNVYNVLGQKVMTLIDRQLQVGYHSANFDGTSLASGIYFYSLEGANVNISKKMLLIK
ncbi:MAG: cohesin domain-containing protein [Melioribacteraceae bacterium]|nr:cohesin domain-containing protein [Melioribacteraceae bacterium]